MRLAAFLLIVATEARAQVTMPRFNGVVPAKERRFIEEMNYAPSDAPLRWLPNGDLLVWHIEQFNSADVYASTCEGSGVFVVPASGNGAAHALAVGTQLCEPGRSFEGATVDPMGRRLLFSVSATHNEQLVSLDLKSGRIDTLRSGCADSPGQHPAFSRDGRFIASDGLCESRDEYEIYAMPVDGKKSHRVGPIENASHTAPTWSANGTRLAYERSSGPLEHRIDWIVVVDSAGRAPKVVAHGSSPAWSPTDEWIAFISEGKKGEHEIHLVHPDGTGERLLFRNAVRSTYSRGWGPRQEGETWGRLVWSPDGREIAFPRSFDRGDIVWAVDVASGRTRQITETAR